MCITRARLCELYETLVHEAEGTRLIIRLGLPAVAGDRQKAGNLLQAPHWQGRGLDDRDRVPVSLGHEYQSFLSPFKKSRTAAQQSTVNVLGARLDSSLVLKIDPGARPL